MANSAKLEQPLCAKNIAGEAAKEAAKEDDKKCYKTYPFEGMKAETNQKETSFIEYAKKRGPLTAEIFHKWSVHRRNFP